MSPLPPERLDEMQTRLQSAQESIASLEDVLHDMRAAGIDTAAQEQRLQNQKAELRKWRTFHELQRQRVS